MWPVFPRSSPTYSVFIWITHLADMDLGKTFPCICWLSPSQFISLHPYNRLDVNTLFIFNCKMFWEVNYTHIFVWRRPCNLINYSKMAMRLIMPVICDYTGCCSVRLALLTPMSAPGVSFHCRRAFAETEESSRVCDCYIFSLLCRHMSVSENWLLFHWRLTKALLWLGYI